ncbi:UDP-glycosyltransferase 87A2 [Platanthera zijinensis]|uniref:Glycosyltransferase n=1 Tax=Platanthera zijinensis TaxID=2320716 RepID=A0AAP0B0T2_9ASPA
MGRAVASTIHVIAAPYPGRGHINPMLMLSRLLASRLPPPAAVTVVLTEEWLSLLGGAASAPPGVNFRTVSNVIPSEKGRAADFAGFLEAVYTKLESPFEQLLDGLEVPATAIVADTFLPWAVDVGKRRGIPVCSFFTMSATMYSALLFFDRLPVQAGGTVPVALAGEAEPTKAEDELVSKYIDGHQSLRLSDLKNSFNPLEKSGQLALNAATQSTKAQCIIFTSAFDLEPRIITALRSSLTFPVLPIGPTIPCSGLQDHSEGVGYLAFLDSQPQSSVLYVSLGSFLSVSMRQMDEIVLGLQASNAKFLLVARDESSRLQEMIGGRGGMVCAWCDQLKVLLHPSVGGFFTHCGWNSTMEAAFAGVPALTFPIMFDQLVDDRLLVDDWGVGLAIRDGVGSGVVVGREKIADLVRRVMGLEGDERREMEKKSAILSEACKAAVQEGGSSSVNLSDLVKLLSPAKE